MKLPFHCQTAAIGAILAIDVHGADFPVPPANSATVVLQHHDAQENLTGLEIKLWDDQYQYHDFPGNLLYSSPLPPLALDTAQFIVPRLPVFGETLQWHYPEAEEHLSRLLIADMGGVYFNTARFPVLTDLAILHAGVYRLEQIHAPVLNTLILAGAYPLPEDGHTLTLEEYDTRFPESSSKLFGAPPLCLSPQWTTLENLRLEQVRDGDFDYSSLHTVPLKRLQLTDFVAKNLDFLAGMPLELLYLAGNPAIGNGDMLATLPLKRLALDLAGLRDYRFLAGLELEELELKVLDISNFSLDLLKNMKLKKLKITGNRQFNIGSLANLQSMPLEELTLENVAVDSLAYLSRESLSLLDIDNCSLKDMNVLESVAAMKNLKYLQLGPLYDAAKKPVPPAVNATLPWNLLGDLPVEVVSVYNADPAFCGQLPHLHYLNLMGDDAYAPELQALQGRNFESLRIPRQVDLRQFHISAKRFSFIK